MRSHQILLVLDHEGYLRHFRTFLSEVTQRDDVCLDLLFLSRKQANSSQVLTQQALKNPKIRVHYFDRNTFVSQKNEEQTTKFYFAINKIFWSGPDKLNLEVLSKRLLKKFTVKNQIFKRDPTHSLLKLIYTLNPEYKLQTMKLLSKDMVKVIGIARKLEALLTNISPSVIVISPFVSGTTRILPIYAWAKKYRVPVQMVMASWDNLENKNIALPEPDKVFVWSKYHREILYSSHGVSQDKIEITGSESLQNWLDMPNSNPKPPKEGLRILYLCSSPFIASSQELLIIEQFLSKIEIEKLHGSDVEVRIRVHPQAPLLPIRELSKESLQSKYSWIRFIDTGRITADSNIEADLFKENVNWATYCAGINTSALLEAACLNKPFILLGRNVAPSLIPETTHIKFLEKFTSFIITDLDNVIFGRIHEELVYPRTKIEEELTANINSNFTLLEHILGGLNTREYSGLSYPPKKPSHASREWELKNFLIKKIIAKVSNKKIFIAVKFIYKFGIIAFFKRLTLHFEEKKYKTPEGVTSNPITEVSSERRISKNMNKYVNGNTYESIYLIPPKKPLIEEDRYIKRLKQTQETLISSISGSDKVIIGPWFSELGHEVLYWIPLVNQLLESSGINPDQVGVISRSGSDNLYKSFSNNSSNALDYFSQDEWHSMIDLLWLQLGGQKQSSFSFEDHDILNRIQKNQVFFQNLKDERTFWLHPSTMFSMFRPFWRNNFSIETISWLLNWPDYKLTETHKDFIEIGMKFYGRPSFPVNPTNQNFVSSVLSEYGNRELKIIANSSYKDDHLMFDLSVARPESLVHISGYKTNLSPQIELCGKSSLFVSTYGGLNYVPLLFGNKSIGIYSDMTKLLPSHQLTANHLAELKNTSMILKNTLDFSKLKI